MSWDIRPLKGVGALTFGMTREQVATVLDVSSPLASSSDEGGGFVREVRGVDTPICHYKNGELFLIDTHAGVPSVTLDGLPVYGTNPRHLLRVLEQRNHGAEAWHGFVVFSAIGINTQGFYDVKSGEYYDHGGQDDRGLGAYRPDAETQMQVTSPITLPAF